MPVAIDHELCRGCGACVNICPGDLLFLVDGRAVPRDDNACWNCFSCAKSCPAGAISAFLPFVLADAGASLRPERSDQGWRWICVHPDGAREELPAAPERPAVAGGGGS